MNLITEKTPDRLAGDRVQRIFLLVYTLAITAWLVWLSFRIIGPVDGGDGMNHFFIAQASWTDPTFLLNHWGKPLFTLFSSPFAQFGLQGMLWFNCCAFAATTLVGFRMLRKLSVPLILQLFFPVLLLLSPDYLANVLAGLTEPFFGFLLVLACQFLLERKYILFAIIVSFLPFARSEGQLMVVLAAGVLLFHKEWKALPFLLIGHFVYAIAGLIALDNFWWYFTDNPYSGDSIYGHGTWDHFWERKTYYLGEHGFLAIGLGLLGLLYVFLIDESRRIRWDFVLFGGLSFTGIVLVHAYLWATGQSGSLGLTRVCTLGLPVMLLIVLYMVRQFDIFHWHIVQGLFLCLLIYMAWPLSKNPYTNWRPMAMEACIIEAADYVVQHKQPGVKAYYYHPLFALSVGVNPKQPEVDYRFRNFHAVGKELAEMQVGDLILRDSHFGPVECGLPLDSIQNRPDWKLLKEFVSPEPGSSYHGEHWNVKIFVKTKDNR